MRDNLGITPDQRVLLYAGAIGEQQALDALVEACALVDDPRLLCLIAGAGIAEDRLRDRARRLGLTNLRFIGSFPKTAMTELMAAADIHYVGLHTGPISRITLPSKIQATLACAKPMIVAVEGDAARVALDSGAGFPVPPGDPEALADVITRIIRMEPKDLADAGRTGREYYEKVFQSNLGVARVEHLLLSAAGGGRGASSIAQRGRRSGR
jgi:colanic acid biosynthesis glycosyl transferase WcaI